MRIFLLLAAIGLAALAGCMAMPDQLQQPGRSPYPPITCEGREQCDAYWARAMVWVAQNSRLKIQVANDTIIQTHTGSRESVSNHFTVTREPLMDGQERITLETGCANPLSGLLGCSLDEEEARRRLHQFVTGKPTTQSDDGVIVVDLSLEDGR